jgi:hypothetical protein
MLDIEVISFRYATCRVQEMVSFMTVRLGHGAAILLASVFRGVFFLLPKSAAATSVTSGPWARIAAVLFGCWLVAQNIPQKCTY